MTYETTSDKARAYEQVLKAMKQGYASTPQRGPPGNTGVLDELRREAVRIVYSFWNRNHRVASLADIYTYYIGAGGTGLKRTLDRRVNEAADPRFYQGPTPIVAVRAGYYIPNPQKFEGLARTMLEALLSI